MRGTESADGGAAVMMSVEVRTVLQLRPYCMLSWCPEILQL